MKIGLSTCSKPFGEELMKQYASAGISCAEISYGKDDTDAFDFKSAEKLAKTYGVELWSFHLPFMPFDVIDISHPDLADFSVNYLRELIAKAGQSGISKVIIHASGEPVRDESRLIRMNTAKRSLYTLNKTATQNGVTICVEDLPRTCLGRNSGEILELTSVDESLRVCFDTNHLLSEKLPDFIRAVGDKIVTTHISDYDFVDEKHWLPGEGKINWQELYGELLSVGYDGPWLYEIGFKPPRSLKRSRNLTCEDFVRNAKEIFSAAPLTVIG